MSQSTPYNCTKCDAYCCKHIALQIDTPETPQEYDTIRWYLLHRDVWVSIDHNECWVLEFKTPCRNITNDFLCGDYNARPSICREYPEDGQLCEKQGNEPSYSFLFTSIEEFEHYLSSKGK